MEELVEKAGRGNGRAFMELVEGLRVQMYRTAYMQLRNEHDALDAIQQTLEKAFANIGSLREGRYFRTWLIRILYNECHNIQSYRKKVIPIEREPGQAEQDNPNVLSRLELHSMLEGLEDIYRQVIDLRYNHDMKIAEIAGLLDIPPGTVKSRLNKAHGLLREQYFEGEVSL